MDNDLLTLPQVRETLQVSYNTEPLHKNGQISIVRISRTKRYIRQEDLDKFIREHTGVYKQWVKSQKRLIIIRP